MVILESGVGYRIQENYVFDNEVIQFGAARSGTTLMWNILARLFRKVWKSHQYIPKSMVEKDTKVFITIRHPRDMVLSLMRVEEDIDDLSSITKEKLEAYITWIESYQKFYETFYNEYDHFDFRFENYNINTVFNVIENNYGEIPENLKEKIKKDVSKEQVLKDVSHKGKRQLIKNGYSAYFLNRNSKHISDKEPDEYFNMLSLNLQKKLNKSLGEFKIFLGYSAGI